MSLTIRIEVRDADEALAFGEGVDLMGATVALLLDLGNVRGLTPEAAFALTVDTADRTAILKEGNGHARRRARPRARLSIRLPGSRQYDRGHRELLLARRAGRTRRRRAHHAR
jgi:hypothetical protein